MFIKKEQLPAKWQRDLNTKERKYHDDPEKKRQAVQKRYDSKRKSIKQY